MTWEVSDRLRGLSLSDKIQVITNAISCPPVLSQVVAAYAPYTPSVALAKECAELLQVRNFPLYRCSGRARCQFDNSVEQLKALVAESGTLTIQMSAISDFSEGLEFSSLLEILRSLPPVCSFQVVALPEIAADAAAAFHLLEMLGVEYFFRLEQLEVPHVLRTLSHEQGELNPGRDIVAMLTHRAHERQVYIN